MKMQAYHEVPTKACTVTKTGELTHLVILKVYNLLHHHHLVPLAVRFTKTLIP